MNNEARRWRKKNYMFEQMGKLVIHCRRHKNNTRLFQPPLFHRNNGSDPEHQSSYFKEQRTLPARPLLRWLTAMENSPWRSKLFSKIPNKVRRGVLFQISFAYSLKYFWENKHIKWKQAKSFLLYKSLVSCNFVRSWVQTFLFKVLSGHPLWPLVLGAPWLATGINHVSLVVSAR